ncbi:hypothetical protein ASG42_11050 [Rhizobium sp. Leaf391]|uniref:ImmA/IrrE family metallo-endopeptidase n=1 Tax=Rhizobium sp. Leaf391 TaxID=1736360 RepID=UPI0007138555|nr:ImmA/IrrE family metallo-endopeptidase [Rhizobium sp. Leaf391]KQS91026.1 hypothetical protein ASG42_11050 [Rhizobium sp. Leaf391]
MTARMGPKPLVESGRITKMLDLVLGEDRFDRRPVDITNLAMEYSRNINPVSPIHEVTGKHLPGCVGALVYSQTRPRQWGIAYEKSQPETRRAFTVAHEFGHYILHRRLIEEDDRFDGGIFCDENSVNRRAGEGIEKEADQFAAALLMPLHDFRRKVTPKERPDIEKLGNMAARYGVSLTAAILRWLEYTDTRALLVVSNEGFAYWAKSSDAALKSGRYFRTKNEVVELPAAAIAVRKQFGQEAMTGVRQPSGIWFDEPVVEMCMRSDRFDQELTLLHFENAGPKHQGEEEVEDTYDRFQPN